MILRGLTEHVRTRNWFAVALDSLILVAGVVIGLRVSHRNEAGAFRVQDHAAPSQLGEATTA